jgi:hypothetical protein
MRCYGLGLGGRSVSSLRRPTGTAQRRATLGSRQDDALTGTFDSAGLNTAGSVTVTPVHAAFTGAMQPECTTPDRHRR